MAILVHSSAIPLHSSPFWFHSCRFLPIPADSCAIPVDSSGMDPFLQESVGHGEVLGAMGCVSSQNLSKTV